MATYWCKTHGIRNCDHCREEYGDSIHQRPVEAQREGIRTTHTPIEPELQQAIGDAYEAGRAAVSQAKAQELKHRYEGQATDWPFCRVCGYQERHDIHFSSPVEQREPTQDTPWRIDPNVDLNSIQRRAVVNILNVKGEIVCCVPLMFAERIVAAVNLHEDNQRWYKEVREKHEDDLRPLKAENQRLTTRLQEAERLLAVVDAVGFTGPVAEELHAFLAATTEDGK